MGICHPLEECDCQHVWRGGRTIGALNETSQRRWQATGRGAPHTGRRPQIHRRACVRPPLLPPHLSLLFHVYFFPSLSPFNVALSARPGGNLAPIRHWPEWGRPAQHLSIKTPWRRTGIARLIAGNRLQAVPKGNFMLGRGDDASGRWEKKNNSGVKECVGKCERGFCKGGMLQWMKRRWTGFKSKTGSLRSRVCVVCWRRCASSQYLHTAVSWTAPRCERTH